MIHLARPEKKAQERLDAITKEFETKFSWIVEFDPAQASPSMVPGSHLHYIVFRTGIPCPEGETMPLQTTFNSATECLEAFKERMFGCFSNMNLISPARTLFWRTRPVIEEQRGRWQIYCRMQWL